MLLTAVCVFLHLFVNVNSVKRPLIILHSHGWSCHSVVVLWADDDDDQKLSLRNTSFSLTDLQHRGVQLNNNKADSSHLI